MSPENFCYWLQGFAEIAQNDTLSEKEWTIVKDHLSLVFDKKTPNRHFPIKFEPSSPGVYNPNDRYPPTWYDTPIEWNIQPNTTTKWNIQPRTTFTC